MAEYNFLCLHSLEIHKFIKPREFVGTRKAFDELRSSGSKSHFETLKSPFLQSSSNVTMFLRRFPSQVEDNFITFSSFFRG